MDSAVISALAAVLGSVGGSSASIATTWIAQHNQTLRQRNKREVSKRERLYSEFVTQLARLSADALAQTLDAPTTLANLANVYGLLGRIRFISSEPVVAAADAATRHVVDLYKAPNVTTAEDVYRLICNRSSPDFLQVFSEACRVELQEFSISRRG